MQKNVKYFLKEIIVFTVVMVLAANIFSWYRAMQLNKTHLVQKAFYLIDDQRYEVASEKPVMIHFWATWCPTCKVEASNIQALSKDFEIITIAVQSGSDDAIKSYLQENKYTFKVVNDSKGIVARKFNVAAYPTTFIYDKEKNFFFSEVGYTSTLGLWVKMWLASF